MDGASAPERLVEEAVRLGLDGLALTDHDGFYGAPMFAEAGAELSVGLPGPQAGVADPEGDHLLVLAGGLSGYRRLAGVLTEGHLAGGEKNRPRFDLEDLEDLAAAGAGEWTVLTGCRKGIVRRALAESDPDARLAAAMAAVRAPPEPAEGGHTPDSYLAELARQGGGGSGVSGPGCACGGVGAVGVRAGTDQGEGLRGLLPDRPRDRVVRAESMNSVPGRGSAAASLVCYGIGVTAIDVMRFRLAFERFL